MGGQLNQDAIYINTTIQNNSCLATRLKSNRILLLFPALASLSSGVKVAMVFVVFFFLFQLFIFPSLRFYQHTLIPPKCCSYSPIINHPHSFHAGLSKCSLPILQFRSSSPNFSHHFLDICSLCHFPILYYFHMTGPFQRTHHQFRLQ